MGPIKRKREATLTKLSEKPASDQGPPVTKKMRSPRHGRDGEAIPPQAGTNITPRQDLECTAHSLKNVLFEQKYFSSVDPQPIVLSQLAKDRASVLIELAELLLQTRPTEFDVEYDRFLELKDDLITVLSKETRYAPYINDLKIMQSLRYMEMYRFLDPSLTRIDFSEGVNHTSRWLDIRHIWHNADMNMKVTRQEWEIRLSGMQHDTRQLIAWEQGPNGKEKRPATLDLDWLQNILDLMGDRNVHMAIDSIRRYLRGEGLGYMGLWHQGHYAAVKNMMNDDWYHVHARTPAGYDNFFLKELIYKGQVWIYSERPSLEDEHIEGNGADILMFGGDGDDGWFADDESIDSSIEVFESFDLEDPFI